MARKIKSKNKNTNQSNHQPQVQVNNLNQNPMQMNMQNPFQVQPQIQNPFQIQQPVANPFQQSQPQPQQPAQKSMKLNIQNPFQANKPNQSQSQSQQPIQNPFQQQPQQPQPQQQPQPMPFQVQYKSDPSQQQEIKPPDEYYKYPIRFFYGPSLTFLPKEVLAKILSYFHSNALTNNPIRGNVGFGNLHLDFNFGLRLEVPPGEKYLVQIRDYYNDVPLFNEEVDNVTLMSAEKFFVHWHIRISKDGKILFDYQFDPRGQRVHFVFHQALGDNITLFPYVDAFQKAYNCKTSCSAPQYLHEILKTYYPNIELTEDIPPDTYASYYMAACINVPICAHWDSRAVTLTDVGYTILSDSKIRKPQKVIFKATQPRKIIEPYVCIAVQASTTAKSWLYPNGWETLVDYIKSKGYRVLCIDKAKETTNYNNTVKMPANAEDFTGDIPLMERVNMIAYADFFVGIGSGLSWIAWSLNVPTVLISGISEIWAEFENPYRVINNMVCHGCFNELRVDMADCYNCKRYANTERQYECSKRITPTRVISAVDRLISDLHR